MILFHIIFCSLDSIRNVYCVSNTFLKNKEKKEKKKHLISQLIFRFKLPGPLVASGDFLCPSAGSVQRDTPCCVSQKSQQRNNLP